jgi:hypothetical protein
MKTVRLPQRDTAPVALHDRAIDNLRYIRKTMERAGAFTAVPGRGGVAMGLSAVLAAVLAARQPTLERWLAVWLAEAIVAIGIASWTMTAKARRAGVALFDGPVGKRPALPGDSQSLTIPGVGMCRTFGAHIQACR